ncbi:MAG TPA: DSD1 family PLP-dependent enzyme [Burkholderiaceae bacterium]|nr:DSD1 family PLP-dependent enzyme [Burkholderiaceae bacterium]
MALDWTTAKQSFAAKETRSRRTVPGDWIPAQVGDLLRDVDTPALIVDLDKCEGNIAKLMAALAGTRVQVRPHAKTHKCVELARQQVAAGAVGVCCQKLGEAEAMFAGQIKDVLITNEIVGESKMRRMARVVRSVAPARLGVCIDNAEIARQLARICRTEQVVLDVYVEIDVGQNRGGLVEPRAAAALARILHDTAVFRFRGVHAYAGLAQHRRGVPERRAAAEAAATRAAQARDAIVAANVPCEVVTGGGTGTFAYDVRSGVYTEVQPGSYLFMDADYVRNEQDAHAPQFEVALFVLATVMSLREDRATLDAGLKAFSTDMGPARPTFAGWRVRNVSDEHTVLMRADDATPIRLGDKALLVPGHCDPTVNLHEWLVATRKGRVEAVWPIEARGRFY